MSTTKYQRWGFVGLVVAVIIIAASVYGYLEYYSDYYVVEHIDPTVQDKISLIVLNYNRPQNLVKNLPYFSKMGILKEIIVGHTGKNAYRDFQHPKVRNFEDWKLETPYGPAIRWTRALSATSDIILFMDDDIMHNEDLIHETYQHLLRNPDRNTIYGCVRRGCDAKGYHMNGKGAVLTPVMMMKKSVLEDFLEHGWPKFESWMRQYRGNGEDLSMNIFIQNFYNESVVYVPPRGRFRYWDKKKGISDQPGHRNSRNDFCKLYYNTTFEL